MYIPSIVRRDNLPTANNTFSTLIIILLSLILVALILVGVLAGVRYYRKKNKRSTTSSSNDHRLTISTSQQSLCVLEEKRGLIEKDGSASPPGVPQIHITFPDEEEKSGKRKSGRVVVVRVGEKSFGMEPLEADAPPMYQREGNGRFQSIDLERIGGLKEKDDRYN